MGTNGVGPERCAAREAEESAGGEAMARALMWLSDAYWRSAPADKDHRVRQGRMRSPGDGPDAPRR
ncbi:hypothetical protein [Embleya sp. NPDC050493]|uniref:hypothetical protein n=1 Tax=Embleya sp. NPDC050493 TaxID=3363989 RepID=UPI0037B9A13C